MNGIFELPSSEGSFFVEINGKDSSQKPALFWIVLAKIRKLLYIEVMI